MALPMQLGPYRIDSTGTQYQSLSTEERIGFPPAKCVSTSQVIYLVEDIAKGTTDHPKKPKKKRKPYSLTPWWKKFDR